MDSCLFLLGKARHADFISRIAAMSGMSAIVVDLSGQGESAFIMNEMPAGRHILEAVEVYGWVEMTYGKVVTLMGTSYGGYIAAYLSLYRFIPKLILRTPALYPPQDLYTPHFYSNQTLTRLYMGDREKVRKHPLFLQERAGKDKVETLLIVHGKDELVPRVTTDAYEASFAARVYVAEGFAHRFNAPLNPSGHMPAYYLEIASFLRQ